MATQRNSVSDQEKRDANADPMTGEHGAHPVGAGVGAALGGAVAGAAAGALGGPIAAAAGAVVGGIAGGLGGKEVAEQIDPTVETTYWREQYPKTSYYDKTLNYQVVEPAYRYGWESRAAHTDKRFEDVEQDLERDWQNRRGTSNLSWQQARAATRDAWDRVDRKCCDPRRQI